MRRITISILLNVVFSNAEQRPLTSTRWFFGKLRFSLLEEVATPRVNDRQENAGRAR